MNWFRVLFVFPLFLIPLFTENLWAASVHSCDWLDSNDDVEGRRSFANGAIRVVYKYSGEPVWGSARLVIYVHQNSRRYCFAVSRNSDTDGFYDVYFSKMTASYNSSRGLLLEVPVGIMSNGENPDVGWIGIRINRAKAKPRVWIEY